MFILCLLCSRYLDPRHVPKFLIVDFYFLVLLLWEPFAFPSSGNLGTLPTQDHFTRSFLLGLLQTTREVVPGDSTATSHPAGQTEAGGVAVGSLLFRAGPGSMWCSLGSGAKNVSISRYLMSLTWYLYLRIQRSGVFSEQ